MHSLLKWGTYTNSMLSYSYAIECEYLCLTNGAAACMNRCGYGLMTKILPTISVYQPHFYYRNYYFFVTQCIQFLLYRCNKNTGK